MNRLKLQVPALIACLFYLSLSSPVSSSETNASQIHTDSLKGTRDKPVVMKDVIVKAERLPFSLKAIPAAASLIRPETDDPQIMGSISDMLENLAGIRAYSTGNIWGDNQVDIRGFYGGGQSEYIRVTYDGIPMNSIASGRVFWGTLNPADVGRMESIAGPVSAQYGDFGFGGLLAFYSPEVSDKLMIDFDLITGSDNAWGINAGLGFRSPSGGGTMNLSKRRNDGWRQHSRFESESLRLNIDKTLGKKGRLSGVITYAESDEQSPGALTESELEQDRTAATEIGGNISPDFQRIEDMRSGLSGSYEISENLELRTTINLSLTETDEVITVTRPVSHKPKLLATGWEISVNHRAFIFDRPLYSTLGGAGEYGELDSDYFTLDSDNSIEDILIREGTAFRRVIAGYLHTMYHPARRLSISAGLRFDEIRSEYYSPENNQSQKVSSFSPKLAVGFNCGFGFRAYGSIMGAFKAPTLVHLYDSPPIYYEFQPGQGMYFNIANDDLKSQTGTCYEIGLKYRDSSQTAARISFYNYEIANEIDFDLSKNRYMNIGRSRHSGIELQTTRVIGGGFNVHLSFNYQRSTFRNGDYRGNLINGVPEIEYKWRIAYKRPELGFLAVHTSGRGIQYIDRANSLEIGEYHSVDFSCGLFLWAGSLRFSLRNIFDRKYIFDGYVGLNDENRYYPAPGRNFIISLEKSF